jgi:hypothetical protein
MNAGCLDLSSEVVLYAEVLWAHNELESLVLSDDAFESAHLEDGVGEQTLGIVNLYKIAQCQYRWRCCQRVSVGGLVIFELQQNGCEQRLNNYKNTTLLTEGIVNIIHCPGKAM